MSSVQKINEQAGNSVIGHYINGQAVVGSGKRLEITNPATGQVVREVVAADKQTVEEAIESATLAFPAWRDTPPLKRTRIMFKFKELLEQNTDVIVAMITEEHGKVLDDAKGEFIRGVEVVEYACAAPELLKGEHSKNVGQISIAGPNSSHWVS